MAKIHPRPFIPAWLDDAGLTAAELRVFVHLCRSADNVSGIAWPSYRRMTEICFLGKTTVRRCLEVLESKDLVVKVGKPFGGSCRYRVLPIVPPQGQLDDNSSTTGTIETLPIVPPQDHNSPSDGTSIVPPQGQEGNPSKVIQRRLSIETADLPFQSKEFVEAWNDWKQHRKEIKKPVTPTSERQQLKQLKNLGECRSIDAINNSISKGYQGIFESKESQQLQPQSRELKSANILF